MSMIIEFAFTCCTFALDRINETMLGSSKLERQKSTGLGDDGRTESSAEAATETCFQSVRLPLCSARVICTKHYRFAIFADLSNLLHLVHAN